MRVLAIAITLVLFEQHESLTFRQLNQSSCNLTVQEAGNSTLFGFHTAFGVVTVEQNPNVDCGGVWNGKESITSSSVLYSEQQSGWMVFIFEDSASVDAQCLVGDYVTPIFHGELLWGRGLRAVVYFVLMMWLFLGIAIISDHFMAAIEVITSKERVIIVENEHGQAEERKVLVWDQTVANLTLMALGSSAPEILLSVIETLKSLQNPMPKEGLGPATIVGSAAYNLLGITAVCVGAIPVGEKKEIEQYGVFLITSFFSVFAYVWIFFVLQDEAVSFWEAVITFMLFPVLVFLSYCQNNLWFGRCRSTKDKVTPTFGGHIVAVDGENHKHIGARRNSSGRLISLNASEKQTIAAALQDLPKGISEEEMARIAAEDLMKTKPSAMHYRMEARRRLTGGRRVIQKNLNILKSSAIAKFSREEAPNMANGNESSSGLPKVSFTSNAFSVQENAGFIKLPVIRSGTAAEVSETTTVFFEVCAGTARVSEDFVYTDGKLVFEPGETEKFITVEIIDDKVYEEDESFTVVLFTKGNGNNADLVNSLYTTCTITIIDDDRPGTISFASGSLVVKESDGVARCVIRRTSGADGKIKLSYRTISFTAKKDRDFYHVEGTLVLDHGVSETSFEVLLIDDKKYEKECTFAVQFEIVRFPECGALYGDHKVLSITITSDDNYKAAVDRVAELMMAHLEEAEIKGGSWMEQLKDALSLDNEKEPLFFDCVLHIFSFPWKVIFVAVPPTTYASGYVSFFVSLVLIGGLTTIVGDVAATFGCLIGWPNGLTAMTLVALGTSLPDTFASKMSAEHDSSADNSIGNITGSNSVNVFLGLGLPWVIATLYTGAPYQVRGGEALEVSVIMFCIIAVFYFVLMTFRRVKGWGELGGPMSARRITIFILIGMWLLFIGYIYAKVIVRA